MNTLLLLLLDSRAPAGAHSHSAGMEAAIGTGLVSGLADLEGFCRVRLATSGRVAAEFAAAACRLQEDHACQRQTDHAGQLHKGGNGQRCGDAGNRSRSEKEWAWLDAEFDARILSEAARAASRQLGGGLRRLLRSVLPGEDLDTRWRDCGEPAPHQPLVLGAGIALAGGTPVLAARAAALAACAGPASAAVRLLGLDPFAVQAMLARLAPAIDGCAQAAARAAAEAAGTPSLLAAAAAPALDLLADVHLTAEVRLFAS